MGSRRCLDEAIRLFKINASQLARDSGVGANQISRYRNEKTDLYTDSLDKIVDALPDDARAYYFALRLQKR